MTESVSLSNVEVLAEPHKGTRGGPSDQSARPPARGGTLVELSHVIRIPLERTTDLPAVVVRVTGAQRRGIDVGALAALDVRGAAVLLHTGDDTRFGTPAYAEDGHFLTEAGAAWLAGHEAALVGIDAVNIDDTADGQRPAHSLLLAAGIPVVEHLTGLGQLPPAGAWFTAAPLRIEGFGTIPVRAFARRPGRRRDPAGPVSLKSGNG